MDGVREFLESSTIHGFTYLAKSSRLVRMFWVGVVFTGFSVAGVLIQQAFSSWASSPISTTIETLPISDLDFPNVTVCPPRNSFTSLNPDLLMARNIIFETEKRRELSDFVSTAALDITYQAYRKEYEEYLEGEGKYRNWYRGISKMEIIYGIDDFKTYYFMTTAPAGSFSTPDFGEPFNTNLFDCRLKTQVYIHVPDNLTVGSKMVFDIEYDISEDTRSWDYFIIHEEVKKYIDSSAYSTKSYLRFDRNKKDFKKDFLVAENSTEAM